MVVEQHLEVVDEAAGGAGDGVAVHQVLGLHHHLGAAGLQPVLALVDEQALVRRQAQFAGVVQGAGGDHDGGEAAGGADGLLADPADRLGAVVAGQDHVAGAEVLDRALGAVGHGDMRAAGEGDAGEAGELGARRLGVDRDEGVVGARAQVGQRQQVGGGDQGAAGLEFHQHEAFDDGAVGGHEGGAAVEVQLGPGAAHLAAGRDLEMRQPLGQVEVQAPSDRPDWRRSTRPCRRPGTPAAPARAPGP